MEKAKKLYGVIKKIYDSIAIAALLVMLFCVVLQVIARYVLKVLIPWTEEASRYLLIFLCACGSVTATRRGDHLGAYFFRDSVHPQARNWFCLISSILSSAFLAIVAYGCFTMYAQQAKAALEATTIPWYQTRTNYLLFGIGCALMIVYTIRDAVWSVQHIVRRVPMDNVGRSSPEVED